MEIREIQVEDSDVYVAHRLEMLRESPDAFLTTAEEHEAMPLEHHVRRMEENARSEDIHMVGAFEGNNLLGSMLLLRQSRARRRHVACIAAVYVTPTARGHGIGGKLLDTLIDHAKQRMRGVEILQLGVASSNVAAIALYRSRGFTTYGREIKAMKSANQYLDEDLMMLDLVRLED